MSARTTFNEGKACDAVVRVIEMARGAIRANVLLPERERHRAPVEYVCSIGERRYAFEHTGVEPFHKHIELERKAKLHFGPIIEGVVGRLPTDTHFKLHVPIKATLDLDRRELALVQKTLIEWIVANAASQPTARLDGYIHDIRYKRIEGVPFEFSLHRVQVGGRLGRLAIVHLVERTIETERRERIRIAYDKKLPKLDWWRKAGAETVLILEDRDIQISNETLIAKTARSVEAELANVPDELYLVTTATDDHWSVLLLRTGATWVDDFTLEAGYRVLFDPAMLRDVTAY